MSTAVRLDDYGNVDVLYVTEVPTPRPGTGEVLVRVMAAGINPGEAKIREGALREIFPSTFPSGQGSDFAGVVEQVGGGVTAFAAGDEVLGWTDDRASHASHVTTSARQVVRKPPELPFEVAGSLFVAGTSAFAAVRAVRAKAGETVVVSGAAGGVGSIAVQLLRLAGARVIAIAAERNHAKLRGFGAVPVAYAADQAQTRDRVRAAAPDGVHAWVDVLGEGYVDMAIELGVEPGRVNTIVDFGAVERLGVQAKGNIDGADPAVLAELAELVAKGELSVDVAASYPLSAVRAAFTELEHGHTHGKIVLIPD